MVKRGWGVTGFFFSGILIFCELGALAKFQNHMITSSVSKDNFKTEYAFYYFELTKIQFYIHDFDK